MNPSRPAPTQPEPGNDPLCAQGGAHICFTIGCHAETDGGLYCWDCMEARAEYADDLEWIDKQGPVVDMVTDKLSCSFCRGEAAAAPAPNFKRRLK